MKRTILFVDDEQRILDGLRRMLRKFTAEWDMHFAPGGAEALALMERVPIDVVVSDVRMPGMDAVALLGRVRELYPHVVRMVLSGHAEQHTLIKLTAVAQQFLSKPCDPDMLIGTVRRACELHAQLSSSTLKGVIGKIRALPAPPKVHARLLSAMHDPNVGIRDVAVIVAKDIGLSAKLLQLVNSAFFGLPRKVNDVAEAANLLGMSTLRDLVLGMEIFAQFTNLDEQVLSEIHHRSIVVANVMRSMFSEKQAKESAYTAGLLHEVGKLVLMTQWPEHARLYSNDLLDPRRAERELFGTDHAEVGAYLLSLWSLPLSVVEPIGNYCDPWTTARESFDITSALYVAHRLTVASPTAAPGQVIPGVMERGLADAKQMEAWLGAVATAKGGSDMEGAA